MNYKTSKKILIFSFVELIYQLIYYVFNDINLKYSSINIYFFFFTNFSYYNEINFYGMKFIKIYRTMKYVVIQTACYGLNITWKEKRKKKKKKVTLEKNIF